MKQLLTGPDDEDGLSIEDRPSAGSVGVDVVVSEEVWQV